MSKLPPPPLSTERKPNSTVIAGNAVAKQKKGKSKFKKALASSSRWLHIYLSMISFAILLFFAVTGLTLNHPDWFADHQTTTKIEGTLNAGWVNVSDTGKIAKLEIAEHFRSHDKIKGAVDEFRIDDLSCTVSFKGPGYTADAFVDRESGKYTINVINSGIVAVMNDLHKGRDSGKSWAWLIDVSAVLMTVLSASGLILILFIKKKRANGLLVAAIGAVACYLIYYLLVP
ncbi:MAG: peptidase [Chitinophagaceae bacterium]|nr:MAG: peptidase [Chitinophagaceae bacterium]